MPQEMTPERWQLIEKLYYDLQDCPSEERAARLAEVCAGDEALRQEVGNLLAADEQASGFLHTPAFHLQAAPLLEPTISLPSREQFGHYQILSKIGEGGMGEVYLAHDTRLERKVALKILPSQFTADASRLYRFIREAKAASALNHPNLITIYEIGETPTAIGSTHFIVTEYIEGTTLRQWAAHHIPSLSEALGITIQICAALDAAHRAGIIHRDIKPENVMIRPDGLVKVLDFGLAKLTAQSRPAESPTVLEGLQTKPGMILGTLRYMSPEQARGQEVDARTDIFSLGVILYELLAKQPLFAGDTPADMIAAILSKETPPLAPHLSPDLSKEVPPAVERIAHKALAKDLRQRYQTIQELQSELQTLKQQLEFQTQLSRSGQSFEDIMRASLKKPSRWLLWAGGALLTMMLGFAAWNFLLARAPKTPRPTPRITKLVNERLTSGGRLASVAFSPDGNLVAYTVRRDNETHLWIKQVTGTTARQITDGKWQDLSPVWSPDGQRLAFLSDRGGTPGIWSVGYLGDTPKLVQAVELETAQLLKWSRKEGKIYYESRGQLFAIDLATGRRTQLTRFETTGPRQFSISPNEEMMTYTNSEGGKSHLWIAPVQGGTPKQITTGNAYDRNPVWFSDNQRLAFTSNRSGQYQIYLTQLDSSPPEQLVVSDDDYGFLAVSPDGAKIIALADRENANLFSADLQTGQESSHTGEFGLQLYPRLSPDNQNIAFQMSDVNSRMDETIMLQTNKPGEQPRPLVARGFDATWSPNGETLAFLRYTDGKGEIWAVSSSGSNEKRLANGVLFSGQTGVPYYRLGSNYQWSPDGTRLAYLSKKSGQENLWVVNRDGSNDTIFTNQSEDGAQYSSPFWSADNQRLLYLTGSALNLNGRKKRACITGAGTTTTIYEGERPFRLLGWSASEQEIFLAVSEETTHTVPQAVSLLKVSLANKRVTPIARLTGVYLHSVTLSADKQTIAMITRATGTDNIQLVAVANGKARTLTNNTDPTAYYSGLSWAPNGKALFYSKQTNWALMSLIENF